MGSQNEHTARVRGEKREGSDMSKPKSKKDACYHKVKARYKVFPSAYASGAIAKCRKVGASNWGNKSKSKTVRKAGGGMVRGEPKFRDGQRFKYKTTKIF